jgi:hypothetical protein
VGIPIFLNLVNLLSGVALITSALVFPPLCHVKLNWSRVSILSSVCHGAIAALGLAAAIMTTLRTAERL